MKAGRAFRAVCADLLMIGPQRHRLRLKRAAIPRIRHPYRVPPSAAPSKQSMPRGATSGGTWFAPLAGHPHPSAEDSHATSRVHQVGTSRDRRHRGRACRCPGPDHVQLEDDQLLWAERGLLLDRPGQRQGPDQAHRRYVGRPHQDPVLRRRRADPGRRRLRRRVGRHGRDELRQCLFLDRQGVRRSVLHRGPVRAQLPGLQRLDVRRRRPAALARGLRPLQSGAVPVRQHRRADDRLVQEADREGGRPEGPEDAHSRASPAGRTSRSASMCGCCRPAKSSRRWSAA